eukprot:g6774.t1
MVAKDTADGSPIRVPPVALKPAATSPSPPAASSNPADQEDAAGAGEEAPHTPQVSSKHWRKIRSAVVALAAFRSRRVKATDFERIRMCGEGGSGLVYLVRLKNTTMFFALKVQRKTDLEAKEKRIRRALIEKEVLVACAHPFVCNLYTAFQDSRHLYLLMDFCAGGDLKSLVRDVVKRALTEEEARFYISEIVAALEWVHLHGYVYRDLKPENVLIHASGHIRLGDFGTAERGSIKCNDLPGEKLNPKEVDRALIENSTPSSVGVTAAAAAVDDGVGGFPQVTPALADSATPPAGAGGNRLLGGGHTFTEEEEADLDDYNTHGGDDGGLDDATVRANSIIVQIDPVLAENSVSSAAPKNSSAPAAAAASAPPPPPAAAATDGVDRSGACVDDGGDESEPQPDRGMSSPVGCGCGRRRGKAAGGTRGPAVHAQPFAKGRGSVKLNVLLDSQTFIGTADFMAPEMVTGKERQGTGMDWWALGVMLYEITLGTLPFHSELVQSSNEVFRSIVKKELKFPRRHNLSRAAVDFIRELLRKDPAERLGQRKGVGEIKRHAFFGSVHWALIANSTPPFVLSGPDTPGWLASMQAAPEAGSRDDKIATWTWMATQTDAPRPGMQTTGLATTSSEAQDSLDVSHSGRHSEADLSKLGDELGISAGPKDTEAAAETRDGNTTKTNDSAGDAPGDDPAVKLSASTSAAVAAAAAASEGDGADDSASGKGASNPPDHRKNKDHRASFDGYDFNTLRKVGSLRMGSSAKNQASAPKLAAARSMGAQGHKPT